MRKTDTVKRDNSSSAPNTEGPQEIEWHLLHPISSIEKNKKKRKGFTLIEILVVLGIIAILAATAIVAINPARQFAQARDAERISGLNTILNAIGQKMADNHGEFAVGCPSLPGPTAADAKTVDTASGGTGVDLSCLVPTYMAQFPVEPAAPTAPSTGYQIYSDANGRVHVLATTTEPSIPRTNSLEVAR